MEDWAHWAKRFPRCVGTAEAARAATRAAYPDLDPGALDELIELMMDQHPPGFALAEDEIAKLDAATDPDVIDFALDILAYLRGLPLQRQFQLAPTRLISAACTAAATATSVDLAAHALERIREEELLRCGRRAEVDRLVATLEAVVEERSCVCPQRSGTLEDQPDLEVQRKEVLAGDPGMTTTTYHLRCPKCDRQWTLEVATDWERRTYQWRERTG